MGIEFGPRRATWIDIGERMKSGKAPLGADDLGHFESFDLLYRCLCALMYNYVPMSGHPGGSISSGRFVAALLFDGMDYDLSDPERDDADIISYAAGHKALGLYALWALRDEVARLAAPGLLPSDERRRLRLEDLLGFRRNPTAATPLFQQHGVKALDGHPTPATPFVKLSTGASGVGLGSSLGLALGAADYFGAKAPRVHIVEGEGGLTPGRAAEALAAAGTASLSNVILHVDWNQASIDSNKVCREGGEPGDYVQWNPMELAYLHDWNVVSVPDGSDIQQVVAAQRAAASIDNGQPTAIVYRTVKGWNYGIEGRASHGAGHQLCSEAFYAAVAPLTENAGRSLPRCDDGAQSCHAGSESAVIEDCFWDALGVVRRSVAERREMVSALALRLRASRKRLDDRALVPRAAAPAVERLYAAAERDTGTPPALVLKAGDRTTLRDELGKVLGHYNRESGGAILTASADLLGSTSADRIAAGFAPGYFNYHTNPDARLLSIGGICEDAMSCVLSGLSSYGRHVGAGSSYGAFLAALGHVAARLHAIGNQAREVAVGGRHRPFILICAHAGLKTGEDGPTHADPQPLQLLQENFPPGTMMTLTPWDPGEIYPLVTSALRRRPAVIAPFVTRPSEIILDREALGLAPAAMAAQGVYLLRAAKGRGDGALVLQESGVTYAFLTGALPLLEQKGIDLDVYYVASAELFDTLPAAERERIFPEVQACDAMGITGFTLPTMYRWIRSDFCRRMTLHPYMSGRFPGSGQADKVLAEAGLDGAGQFKGVMRWLDGRRKPGRPPARKRQTIVNDA